MFRDKAILEALAEARRVTGIAITECHSREQKLAADAYRAIAVALDRARNEVEMWISVRDRETG